MTRIKPNEIAQAQRFAQEPVEEYTLVPMIRKASPNVRQEIDLSTVICIELEKALDRILGETP
jgi:hypothetical protein